MDFYEDLELCRKSSTISRYITLCELLHFSYFSRPRDAACNMKIRRKKNISIERRSHYFALPGYQYVWVSTNRGPANLAGKRKILTCMFCQCMITLRNKTVAHTILPSFDTANGRLCEKRLLRSRHFATMII